MTYPLTSCPCGACKPTPYFVEPSQGPPSGLALADCKEPRGFKCSRRQVYKVDEQPKTQKNKCTPLNQMGIRLQCDKYRPFPSSCGMAYLGTNPKLVDIPRGQPILLDRPNYTGQIAPAIPYKTLYTKEIANYGKGYTDISDINAGQIQYYTMSDTSDAYFKPNFVTPATVTHEVVKDPMGVFRPQYNRVSHQTYSYKQSCPDECDSRTHDTLEFRQELMEKQMRKRNEQRWDARWA